jgi:Spy/CpxP family protein refolding chaperone
MSRLIESVNQRTPQADALIAPELLTAMAGGQGSGLRMTEAEIRRIVGGRTAWEGLTAALNQWKRDPSKGLSITDAQREQISSLAQAMHDRIQRKLSVAYGAADRLTSAGSVEDQRKVVNEARRLFSEESDMGTIGQPKAAPSSAPSSGADVLKALGVPPRPGGAAAPSSPVAAPPAVAASPDGTRFVQNPATGEVHPLAPGFEVPPGWKQVQ